jgi:hypothetical protein
MMMIDQSQEQEKNEFVVGTVHDLGTEAKQAVIEEAEFEEQFSEDMVPPEEVPLDEIEIEDERFHQKESDPEHKKIKKSIEAEARKEKRINAIHKLRNWVSSDIDEERFSFVKLIYVFSRIVGYLFNLFTIVIIVLIIWDLVRFFYQSGIENYFQAIKLGIELVFLWLIAKVHEKIEG